MRRALLRFTLIGITLQVANCTSTYAVRGGGTFPGVFPTGGAGAGGGQAVPNAGQPFTPGQQPRANYNTIFGSGGGP
jgi:hypothetical protein